MYPNLYNFHIPFLRILCLQISPFSYSGTRWYTSIPIWCDAINSTSVSENINPNVIEQISLGVGKVVHSLFYLVQSWNTNVMSNFNWKSQTQGATLKHPCISKKNNLYKIIFLLENDLLPSNGTVMDWSHGMMRSVILDWLLWIGSSMERYPLLTPY